MSKEPIALPHTALPWRYQGWDDTPGDRGAYILGGGPENSADEYMVGAALPLPITNRVECEANARFIVRAVNSYEPLLKAAKTVLADLNARIRTSVRENGPIPLFDGIAALHEAIALAEKDQSQRPVKWSACNGLHRSLSQTSKSAH